MRIRSTLTMAAVITTASLLLTACGGGGDDDAKREPSKAKTDSAATTPAAARDEEPTTDDKAAVEEAYRTWLASYAKGDGGATCEAATPAYRKSFVADANSDGYEFGDTCEAVVKAVAAMAKGYGQDLTDQPITSTEIDGDTATLHVGKGDDREVVTMEREGGEWLVADSKEDTAGARVEIDKWLGAWCSLKVGMTKAEATKIMGEPTGEFDETQSANPQIEWGDGAYSFTAFLDTGGVVKQLQSDYSDFGAADRAKVKCPDVRK